MTCRWTFSPIDVGVGRSDVLDVDGEVVSGLDVDVLEGGEDLGGQVPGTGLDQAGGLTGSGLPGGVEGHDPELVDGRSGY